MESEYLVDTLKNLVHLQSLTYLNLSRNHLKDTFVKSIVPILNSLKLSTLDLSATHMTDEGFLYLCPYLSTNKSLVTLKLNYNKFTKPAVAQ